MHSSLETRYPFLDNKLAEFLLTFPPDVKLRGFTGKYLLRQCASRWLPKTIAWRLNAMFRAPGDFQFTFNDRKLLLCRPVVKR